jgi:hypothetical protein
MPCNGETKGGDTGRDKGGRHGQRGEQERAERGRNCQSGEQESRRAGEGRKT